MPTILITGANRGLGQEFVRQYKADGWRVIATVRDLSKGRDASEAGGEVHLCDVADAEQISRLAKGLAGVELDAVLCNAGIYGTHQDLGDINPEEFLRVVRVTDKSKIFAAMSSMMGSVADNTSGGSYAYRTSKAGLNMVIKGLSVNLKDKGIVTVALSPGWVRTDMGGASAPLEAPIAVAGMRKVLNDLIPEDTGKFFHYDGSVVPW